MKPMLIGLTGKPGSGKSSTAQYFIARHRFSEKMFSEKMKHALVMMFGINREAVFGTREQKNKVIPKLSRSFSPSLEPGKPPFEKKEVTGTKLLQTLGSDWAQDMINPDIWIADIHDSWEMMKGVPGFAGMVVSDVRYDNQAAWIKSRGGIIIEIHNPAISIQSTLSDEHKAEAGLSRHLIDYCVRNNKRSLGELYEDLDELMVVIQSPPCASRFDPGVTGPAPLKTYGEMKRHLHEAAADWEKPIKQLVVEWADEVFPNRDITNALTKMVMHEIPEYLMNQSDRLELADLGILLYDIAHLAGVDLEEAIREKMVINKQRMWAIDTHTGLMSHVKEGDELHDFRFREVMKLSSIKRLGITS